MPLMRTQRRGQVQDYMQLLVGAFNPAAAEGIMCRDTISIGWDGRLYDCDFNQQLEMGMPPSPAQLQQQTRSASGTEGCGGEATDSSGSGGRGSGLTVFDIGSLGELRGRAIRCDNHCFGCTAGAGSSCTGSVA